MRKKHKKENKMTEEKEVESAVAVIETPEMPKEVCPSELDAVRMQIELEKAKLELEELRAKSRAMSSRVHDEQEIAISEKMINTRNEDKTIREKIRTQKAYDNQMVTGRFLNRRAPGQMAKLAYIKYDDDPVKWYELYDGRVYTIPQGFVDQINEYYCTPVFIQKDGPIEDADNPGSQIAEVDRSNKKYAFVSTALDRQRIA